MKYRYRLPDGLVSQVSQMEEFANGATQLSAKLQNGIIFSGILVSDATYIIAARGFIDLPFEVSDIASLFQTPEDKNPTTRGGWQYWDEWS